MIHQHSSIAGVIHQRWLTRGQSQERHQVLSVGAQGWGSASSRMRCRPLLQPWPLLQHSPTRRCLLAPSLFFSSLLFLKLAKDRMLSTMPHLATLSRNCVLSSHLEPKLLRLEVRFSLVCRQHRLCQGIVAVLLSQIQVAGRCSMLCVARTSTACTWGFRMLQASAGCQVAWLLQYEM